jgi:hypothetical protein
VNRAIGRPGRIREENFKIESYEGASESLGTGRLEQELQMVQLSTTRCRCFAIL